MALGRALLYVLACVFFSLGVKLFIEADLGVDPLNSMIIGIVETFDRPYLRLGVVATSVTILFLVVWGLWNRSMPPLMTLVSMGFVGFLVDLWNFIELERVLVLILDPWPMMLLGLALEAYGSALIIMIGIGMRVMDLIAVSMVKKWRIPFVCGKLTLEMGFITVALFLDGPIGVATIAFLYLVAPFIPSFMWANERWFHLENRGLGAPAQTPR